MTNENEISRGKNRSRSSHHHNRSPRKKSRRAEESQRVHQALNELKALIQTSRLASNKEQEDKENQVENQQVNNKEQLFKVLDEW